MNIILELEKSKKEYDYFVVEYEAKLSENIFHSINYCLNSFYDFFIKKGFIVEKKELYCEALSVNYKFNFKPKYDYKKEPRKMRLIQIQRTEININKKTEFILAILNDAPLPKGDFIRLLTNPTKGMSEDEKELREKLSSIEYFKEYISTKENSDYWVFQAVNETEKQVLGDEKNIFKHFDKMIAF